MTAWKLLTYDCLAPPWRLQWMANLTVFLRFDNCQMTAMRITWLPKNCWWLPESCWWLPGTCLMTALTNAWPLLDDYLYLYVSHDYLRTAWKRIDNCQMTAWNCWCLPCTCLMTALTNVWRLLDDYLRTAWHRISCWLPGNALMTAWPLPDDCLKYAWRLHQPRLHISQLKLCPLWQVYEDSRSLKIL